MLVNAPSDSTMKRLLADAVSKGLIEVYGKGPATKYSLTPQAQVTMPLDIDTYFKNEMDDRTVQENFNFELIKQILPKVSLFTEEECKRLDKAQSTFRTHLEITKRRWKDWVLTCRGNLHKSRAILIPC